MILYELARKMNRRRKAEAKRKMGRFVSPVRRIERVAAVAGERVCAMTFDDGPTATVPSPDIAGGVALSRYLVDVLKSYGATATFDVIGDTSENYPDVRGEGDSFYWGGKSYDHYPDFEADRYAGAKNCPELVRYILDSGFELSNHSYRHLIFGKSGVYRQRVPFDGMAEVMADLKRLHRLVEEEYHYEMKLARPPHYIDKINGGFSSYDAYELMGYHYMAASFDGKGWMPQKDSFEQDVEEMVRPLREALAADENALNGQIIFQKDGCNMSLFTPVAAALPLQLALLKEYGYRVCSVGELLSLSPYEDISAADECFDAVCALEKAGFVIGCKNNTFQPEREFTVGELLMAVCPEEERKKRVHWRLAGKNSESGIGLSHPYAGAAVWAKKQGLTTAFAEKVNGTTMKRVLTAAGYDGEVPEKPSYTRGEAVCLLREAVMRQTLP